MFNIFTLAFFAVFIGLGLAMIITRQKTPQPLQLVPPEDDSLIDPKEIRELTLEDLYVVGEKLCEENKLEIKDRVTVSENEVYWIAASTNEFFFGNYVLGFFKIDADHRFVSLPTIFEFKDFIKSVTSTKGFFFTTGYFTKDVHQPLEGAKIALYNRLKIITEYKRLKLPFKE
ncbi:MAG: hypothetical protein HQ462_02305 [Deltaproteobacteria bacterium]|nr:hypothetical protein [Deltaproteobacteria bacterium]